MHMPMHTYTYTYMWHVLETSGQGEVGLLLDGLTGAWL